MSTRLDDLLSLAAALDPKEIASIKISVTFAGGSTREVNVALTEKAPTKKANPIMPATPIPPAMFADGTPIESAALIIFGPEYQTEPSAEAPAPRLRIVTSNEGEIT